MWLNYKYNYKRIYRNDWLDKDRKRDETREKEEKVEKRQLERWWTLAPLNRYFAFRVLNDGFWRKLEGTTRCVLPRVVLLGWRWLASLEKKFPFTVLPVLFLFFNWLMNFACEIKLINFKRNSLFWEISIEFLVRFLQNEYLPRRLISFQYYLIWKSNCFFLSFVNLFQLCWVNVSKYQTITRVI